MAKPKTILSVIGMHASCVFAARAACVAALAVDALDPQDRADMESALRSLELALTEAGYHLTDMRFVQAAIGK